MKLNIKKFKINKVGKYNRSIYRCFNCDHSIISTLFDNAIGWTDTSNGNMLIVECPNCFEKYYFHMGCEYEKYFLESISDGKNIHFKKENNNEN